jgi:hypothetical protein
LPGFRKSLSASGPSNTFILFFIFHLLLNVACNKTA